MFFSKEKNKIGIDCDQTLKDWMPGTGLIKRAFDFDSDFDSNIQNHRYILLSAILILIFFWRLALDLRVDQPDLDNQQIPITGSAIC